MNDGFPAIYPGRSVRARRCERAKRCEHSARFDDPAVAVAIFTHCEFAGLLTSAQKLARHLPLAVVCPRQDSGTFEISTL